MFRIKKNNSVYVPNTPIVYPDGVAIRTDKGTYYIKDTYRLLAPSQRVIASWNFERIIESSETAAGGYKVLGTLGFRNGTFIRDVSTGKYYLISKNKRLLVTDPDRLAQLGLSFDDAWSVSKKETELHRLGGEL